MTFKVRQHLKSPKITGCVYLLNHITIFLLNMCKKNQEFNLEKRRQKFSSTLLIMNHYSFTLFPLNREGYFLPCGSISTDISQEEQG